MRVLFIFILLFFFLGIAFSQSYQVIDAGGGRYRLVEVEASVNVGEVDETTLTQEVTIQRLLNVIRGAYRTIAQATREIDIAKANVNDLKGVLLSEFGVDADAEMADEYTLPLESDQWVIRYKSTDYTGCSLSISDGVITFSKGAFSGTLEMFDDNFMTLTGFVDTEVINLYRAENNNYYLWKGEYEGEELYIGLAK